MLMMEGCEVIVDTQAHTGHFCALQVHTTAAVSAVTYEDDYEIGESDWTDLGDLFAGEVLYGRFKSITLSKGKAIAARI